MEMTKKQGEVLKCQNQGQNIQNITEWVQFQSKNIEFLKFSNIPSKLMGKKHNNSRKKLKVLANPLGLLAENRSNKKAWASPRQRETPSWVYGPVVLLRLLLWVNKYTNKSFEVL